MPETKTTYEYKNLPPQLIVLTSGTELIQSIPIEGADLIDITLTITKKTQEPK